MNFTAKNVGQPFALDDEILLHPVGPVAEDQWTEFNGEQVIRNVVTPTLICFRPPAGVPHCDESVIVAPGGGMLVLAIENEGIDVARKLALQGYTAYVLKYRVSPTPADADGFKKTCVDFFQDKMSNGFGCADPHLETPQAVDDLLAAVAWVRSHDMPTSRKLHFVGFSAGAKVCIDALDRMTSPDRFSSIGLIYFSLSHPGLHGVDLPPLFTAMANDDPLFSRSGFGLVRRWQEAERPLEFHLFKSGGHGFGMRRQGTTSDQWWDLYVKVLMR